MSDGTQIGKVGPEKVYEQRCAEFRSLNGFFWQIPLIVMTLNGGLWFAVASLDLTQIARGMILAFAGLANIAMIVVLWRLRGLLENLLTQIHAAEDVPEREGGRVVLWTFCILFAVAAAGAFGAAISQPAIFKAKAEAPKPCILLATAGGIRAEVRPTTKPEP